MSNTIIREAQNSDSEQLYMLFKKHAEYESCILHVSNQKQALSNLDEYPMCMLRPEPITHFGIIRS